MQYTLDPRALELIAPAIFKNDRPPNAQVYPASVRAQQTVGLMLLEMPEVPDSVKDWVRSLQSANNTSLETRDLFRGWWKNNESKWQRRAFAELQPGADLDTVK